MAGSVTQPLMELLSDQIEDEVVKNVGRGTLVTQGAGALSITPGLPSGVQAGDQLLCLLFVETNALGTDYTSVTMPGSWSLVGVDGFAPSLGTGSRALLLTDTYEAGDSAPTFSRAENMTKAKAQIFAFRNAAPILASNYTSLAQTGNTVHTVNCVLSSPGWVFSGIASRGANTFAFPTWESKISVPSEAEAASPTMAVGYGAHKTPAATIPVTVTSSGTEQITSFAVEIYQGGISHTETVTDNLGITDTVIASQQHNSTASDSIGITDSATVSTEIGASSTDSLGLTDNVNLSVQLGSTVIDDEGITDSVTVSLSQSATVADSEGLSDIAVVSLQRSASVDDNLGVTDSAVVEVAKLESRSDDLGVTDSVTVSQSHSLTTSDILGMSDTVIVEIFSEIVGLDTEQLTDTTSIQVTLGQNPVDSETVTDSVVINHQHGLSATDESGLTDSATASLAANLSSSDNVSITDSVEVQLQVIHFVDTVDQLAISDSIVVDLIPAIQVSSDDTLGLSDSATVDLRSILQSSPQDLLGISDSVQVELVVTGDFQEARTVFVETMAYAATDGSWTETEFFRVRNGEWA